MVWAYFVGAHPHQLANGKWKRQVKYIDTKGKDHDRDFLTDENGNFKSKVYGGVDADGNAKCATKSEAENYSLSDRQSRRDASGASARAHEKYVDKIRKREYYVEAFRQLEDAGVKFKRSAQKIGTQKKHMTKHDVHIPDVGVYNKKEIRDKWRKHFDNQVAQEEPEQPRLTTRHNPHVRPPFAQH